MRLKVLDGGRVVNIIEAPSIEWAQAAGYVVEVDDSTPDYTPVNAPARRIMSKLEFRRRFTQDELVRMDNPELFIQGLTDIQRAAIRTMQRNFDLAEYIDLDDPLVVDGLQLMVSHGLLTPSRFNEILGRS